MFRCEPHIYCYWDPDDEACGGEEDTSVEELYRRARLTLNGSVQCDIHVWNKTNGSMALLNTEALITSHHFEFVVSSYLIGTLCLIGILGNVLSLVVMKRDRERRKLLTLLKWLAFADLFYLIVALVRHPIKYWVSDYLAWEPLVEPLFRTAQTLTIWSVVLVSLDRYDFVCHPLRCRIFPNLGTKCRSVQVMVVVAVAFNLPRYFQHCVKRRYNICRGYTMDSLEDRKPFYNNDAYQNLYNTGAYCLFLYIVPLGFLFFTNTRLIQAIMTQTKKGRLDANYNDRAVEHNATMVLVIIVVMFILFETPELLLKLCVFVIRQRMAPKGVFPQAAITYCNSISELLMVTNSSINFFIYLATVMILLLGFGRRFRSFVKSMLIPQSLTLRFTMETVPMNQNVPPPIPLPVPHNGNKRSIYRPILRNSSHNFK